MSFTFDEFQNMNSNVFTGINTTVTTNNTYTTPNTGLVYTTNGTSPYWIDNTITAGNISNGVLKVQGDAEFEGDLKLKGKSLNESLTKIEERLAILHPNEKLEAKWDKLKAKAKAANENCCFVRGAAK